MSIYNFYSDFVSDLGTGVSILSPKQCLVMCKTEQRPRCKECCRAVDGPDPVPKSSGTPATDLFPPKMRADCGSVAFSVISLIQMFALTLENLVQMREF